MSKGKLAKFAEVQAFENVVEPPFDDVFKHDYPLKGRWSSDFFKNQNPLALELACGRGEYTVGLARIDPTTNFIGMDIKGARIWKGAKEAIDDGLPNAAFIRTRIEFLRSFYAANEVSDIWITFPDPQLKKPMKRLTSTRFLAMYQKIQKPGSSIHLKTDNEVLYNYTMASIEHNKLELIRTTTDIYQSELANDARLCIKTYYENSWHEIGLTSKYIEFKLPTDIQLSEPPEID